MRTRSTEKSERSSSSSRSPGKRTTGADRGRAAGSRSQNDGTLFGMETYRDGMETKLQRLADTVGASTVRQWADEGMPTEIMGSPSEMEAFRERQAERPAEVPKDVERRNAKSVQRSKGAHHEASKAGDAGVPDSVRDIISSSGQSLDVSIQRAMEDRLGDSFGDVRVHTGPKAAKACQDINARAFTVGNHIAFNRGEYDPESPEGQHVLAHELAHVRQQTGGAVSMLPEEGAQLEIDPDPRLEREAEEAAQQAMQDGPVTVRRMGMDVHVQRLGGAVSSLAGAASTATEMFQTNKQLQKDEQQARADSFASMGGTDGALAERVGALEQEVSQLGSYVAEQVAPADGIGERLKGSVPKEGVKEALKIGAGGAIGAYTAMQTKSPEVGVASAMAAQTGVEALSSQAKYAGPMVPDVGTEKLGDIKDSIEGFIDEKIRQRLDGSETGDYPGN